MYKASLVTLLLLAALAVAAMASDEAVVSLNQNLPDTGIIFQKDINHVVFYPAPHHTKPPVEKFTVMDAPANDNCADAQPISGSGTTPYTTLEATIDGPQEFIKNPNVWFQYTSRFTGPVQVTLSDTSSEYEQSYTRCGIYQATSCPEAIDFPSPTQLPGGETIETATDIGSLPAYFKANLNNYQQDFNFSSCSYYYYMGGVIKDAVWSYTATSNGIIDIAFDGFMHLPYDPLLVITDSQGNELACNHFNQIGQQLRILDFSVVTGETYYIVVSNLNGIPSTEEFGLKIYSPDFNFISTVEEGVGVGRNTFMAVAGQQYLFEIGAPSTSPSPNCVGWVTVTENPRIPENDNCENATDGQVLQPGSTIQLTGDNRGAPSFDCPQLCYFDPNVWVTFELNEPQSLALDLCGTPDAFNSSYLFLTKDCPCDPNNIVRSTNYAHSEICHPSQLRVFFNNLEPGQYWFPITSGYHSESEYTFNIRSLIPQTCNDYALFGQNPLTSDVANFNESDSSGTYSIADDFFGVNGPISKITWWGDIKYSFNPCDVDSFPVSIVFFNSISGDPGDTIAAFNLMANVTQTGYLYNHQFYQRKFVANLSYPVTLTDGWVMIRGISQDNCALFWQINLASGGFSEAYNPSNHRWSESSYDYAFCLDSTLADAVNEEPVEIPSAFELYQNYPNPFNASTVIQFSLISAGMVNLSVYDIKGALVKTIYDGFLTEGTHNLSWDGKNESGVTVASGTFFYRLKDSKGTSIKSMILLK